MKYLRNISSIIFIIIVLLACDESFNPKTEYQEDYIVNAVINGDTTYQFITIQKSYNPTDFNPLDFAEDTFISGADVSITYKDSVYLFAESTAKLENNPRFDGETAIYINNELIPETGSEMILHINLPSGKSIDATTTTPKYTRLRFNKNSDVLIPPSDGFLDVEWEISDGDKFRQVYLPEVKIAYYKIVDGQPEYNEKTIPLNYIDRRGELVPNYPLPNNKSFMHYEIDAIDKTMQLISEGDPEKQNYIVLGALFQILLLDDNLVPYYMSTETFLGGYSIILDQLDYTNINGGRGIFASYYVDRSFFINIDELYINSFGYRHE